MQAAHARNNCAHQHLQTGAVWRYRERGCSALAPPYQPASCDSSMHAPVAVAKRPPPQPHSSMRSSICAHGKSIRVCAASSIPASPPQTRSDSQRFIPQRRTCIRSQQYALRPARLESRSDGARETLRQAAATRAAHARKPSVRTCRAAARHTAPEPAPAAAIAARSCTALTLQMSAASPGVEVLQVRVMMQVASC